MLSSVWQFSIIFYPKLLNLRPMSFHIFSLMNRLVNNQFDFKPLLIVVKRLFLNAKSGTDTHTTQRGALQLRD